MPNNSGAAPPEPPSLQKRLPLALALMMLVLLVSQYLFKPAPGPKPVTPTSKEPPAAVVKKPAAPSANENVAPAPGGSQIQADAEALNTIDTDLYRIVFSNRGAVVKSWVLKKFQDDGVVSKRSFAEIGRDFVESIARQLGFLFDVRPGLCIGANEQRGSPVDLR